MILNGLFVVTVNPHSVKPEGKWKSRFVVADSLARNPANGQENFSPTGNLDSLRLMLKLAAIHGCRLFNADISKAYLRGKRSPGDHVIVIRRPRAMDDIRTVVTSDTHTCHDGVCDTPDHPRFTANYWYCTGNVYGLQQAGVILWRLIKEWLLSLGFEQLFTDPNMFIFRSEDGFILLLVYVDDFEGACSTLEIGAWFFQKWRLMFDSTIDFSDDHPFLGFHINRLSDGSIRLAAPATWPKLDVALQALDMDLPAVTQGPFPSNAGHLLDLPVSEANPVILPSQVPYLSILGLMLYAGHGILPAELHGMCRLAQFGRAPPLSACAVLVWLATWLSRNSDDHYLLFDSWCNGDLFSGVSDASHGNAPGSRSWFGYLVLCHNSPVCFRASSIKEVTLSTRDSEGYAALELIKTLLFIRLYTMQGGFAGRKHRSLPIYTDSAAWLQGAANDNMPRASRYAALRLAFVREIVGRDLVGIHKVSSPKNLADIFTKFLTVQQHMTLRPIVMGQSYLQN